MTKITTIIFDVDDTLYDVSNVSSFVRVCVFDSWHCIRFVICVTMESLYRFYQSFAMMIIRNLYILFLPTRINIFSHAHIFTSFIVNIFCVITICTLKYFTTNISRAIQQYHHKMLISFSLPYIHLVVVFSIYFKTQGFTAHRNTEGATSFMVNKLHFPTKEAAQIVRDEYFTKYHSTCKGLMAAEADGRLPPVTLPNGRTNIFDPHELDEYWANTLDYTLLGCPDPKCIDLFEQLLISTTTTTTTKGGEEEEEGEENQLLNIIAFSNGPRKYVLRVLDQIGLSTYFTPQHIFGVTDVLPHCKPDVGSFQHVFQQCNVQPQECIMVEDSMKNIRQAKALGMRTILILGKGRRTNNYAPPAERVGEAINDSPDETDPAVDAAVEVAADVTDVLRLWGIIP